MASKDTQDCWDTDGDQWWSLLFLQIFATVHFLSNWSNLCLRLFLNYNCCILDAIQFEYQMNVHFWIKDELCLEANDVVPIPFWTSWICQENSRDQSCFWSYLLVWRKFCIFPSFFENGYDIGKEIEYINNQKEA